jgi:hypothetical protein
MSILLLVVGLLATAAGFVAIGFGIPNNAFSLGNTLIVAGTVAVAAGLILIGLAAVVGHLRRITDALKAQALPRPGRLPESVEPLVPPSVHMAPAAAPSPVPTRMPPPPKPPEMREAPPPDRRQPEPGFAAPPSEVPGPLDWLRAKSRPAMPPPPMVAPGAPEPTVVEVSDEAPLSPRPSQRPPVPPAVERALEPKFWTRSRPGGAPEPQPPSRPDQTTPRATPQMEPARDKQGFDLVWPEQQAAPAPGAGSAKPESAGEMPPPFPSRPRESRPAERRAEAAPKPASERAPAILKSGVIDGMPYTLYADGSIEAELPHGTVKFASVDALRAHLEKQGG